MKKTPNGSKDRKNSEPSKSEEFKNFESVVDSVLSLDKKQVAKVKRSVPKTKRKTRTNSA